MKKQVDKNMEEEFLEPSFKYLVKNGLENTSVRDLCRTMGISYGSVYYWFDGKDDIYISVVKYGIGKVTDELFEISYKKMHNPEEFFKTFIEDVDKLKMELRLIYQVTASPVYGPRMRERAFNFKTLYESYAEKLSVVMGCSKECMLSIIYALMSIVGDYIVWEDYEGSMIQLNLLYDCLLNNRQTNKKTL